MTQAPSVRSRARDGVVAGVLGVGLIAAFGLTPSAARSGPLLCPFRGLTGLPCPLCGATRSWVDLAHGDVASAVAMNPVAPLLFVTAGVVFGALVGTLLRRRSTDAVWARAKPWLLALAAIVTVVGVSRAGGVALGVWSWDG